MTIEIVPTQNRFLEPYLNKVFQHNNPNSNIFLSNYTNNLLRILGTDVVLSGLDIDTIEIQNDNKDINVTLNIGKLIVDTTYIEVTSQPTVTFPDANLQNTTGNFIVFTDFRFLNNPYNNPLRIKIDYLSSGGTVLGDWSGRNRIVLAAINFEVSSGSITSATDAQVDSVIINSQTYIIGNSLLDLDVDGGWI